MNTASVWQLRLDVLWVLALVRVFTAGRGGEPKPEVHLFLGDRYWRLADYYAERGRKQKALRLRAKANNHLSQGHWNPPLPPAMAMAVPQRPTLRKRLAGV
jgi:hypothetical protein